jgi:hypothetical protein
MPVPETLKDRVMAMLIDGLARDIAARDNTVVGLLAEAMVALALDGELATHRWEAWDVTTRDGGKVQVKTSTGMSIGKPLDASPSVARWSGFKGGTRWDAATNKFDDTKRWWADVWVLARVDGFDAFDESAWSFFVLTRAEIQELKAQSTSAATLRTRGHQCVPLPELSGAYLDARSRLMTGVQSEQR